MKISLLTNVISIAFVGAVLAQGGATSLSIRPIARPASHPDPRDFVVVREGSSFIVPAGHVFVATGVGSAANSGSYSFSVDGQVVASSLYAASPSTASGIIAELPPGIVADSGASVECVLASFSGTASSGTGRVWGFLLEKDSAGRTPAVLLEHPPVTVDRVMIREGQPFVVPADKLFVLTGIGSTASYPNHSVRIDGTIEASGGTKHWHATSIVNFPPGLTATAGAVIEVVDMPDGTLDFGEGIALGYLLGL
jgi:hypothetical protein